MSLWLVRHAQPLIASGTCYGALDVSADVEQTLAAAQALAEQLPAGMAVQVSPLMRCRQMAVALAQLRPDLRFTTDPHLREMDFGCWEGVAWADIPRTAVDDWTQDFANHRFGGRESANEVLSRVALSWDALQQSAASRDTPQGDALWISHAGVAHAALLLQKKVRRVASAEDWPTDSLAYGAWIKF